MIRILFTIVVLLASAALPASAQEPPEPPPEPPAAAPDTGRAGFDSGLSPMGAFARSLTVPGWGQLYVGAPRRAAVFISLQTTSYAMLYASYRRLGDIRSEERRRVDVARDSIFELAAVDTALARRIEDPLVLDDLIGEDADVADARGLVRARQRHRQDWVAYTIFFTMASAIDAYVAAHLADFPADIRLNPTSSGGVSLHVAVPAGRKR